MDKVVLTVLLIVSAQIMGVLLASLQPTVFKMILFIISYAIVIGIILVAVLKIYS